MDSTVIDLWLSLLPWADFRLTKTGDVGELDSVQLPPRPIVVLARADVGDPRCASAHCFRSARAGLKIFQTVVKSQEKSGKYPINIPIDSYQKNINFV
jgi:hypothetical protein